MWRILPRSYSHRFPASRLALSGISPLEIVKAVWLMITPSFSTTEEDTPTFVVAGDVTLGRTCDLASI